MPNVISTKILNFFKRYFNNFYTLFRFGKGVRLLSSACFTLQMVVYMSIVVYAPALALEQVNYPDSSLHVYSILCSCPGFRTGKLSR
jgi:hypothetical protein